MLNLTLCWLLNPNAVGMLFDSVPVVFHPLCLFPTLSLFHLLVPIHPLLLSLSSPGLSLLLNTLILHQHILSSSSNPSKRGSSACQVLCQGSTVVASSSMFCIWGFFFVVVPLHVSLSSLQWCRKDMFSLSMYPGGAVERFDASERKWLEFCRPFHGSFLMHRAAKWAKQTAAVCMWSVNAMGRAASHVGWKRIRFLLEFKCSKKLLKKKYSALEKIHWVFPSACLWAGSFGSFFFWGREKK